MEQRLKNMCSDESLEAPSNEFDTCFLRSTCADPGCSSTERNLLHTEALAQKTGLATLCATFVSWLCKLVNTILAMSEKRHVRKRLQLYFHVSALAQTSASRPQPAVQRFADVAALFALQLAREVQDSGPRQVRNVGHDSLLCSVDVGLVGDYS